MEEGWADVMNSAGMVTMGSLAEVLSAGCFKASVPSLNPKATIYMNCFACTFIKVLPLRLPMFGIRLVPVLMA